MPSPTGAHTTLWYLWEDAGFGAAPADTDQKPPGGNATLDTNEGSNNAVEVFEPNDREVAQLIAQHFDGSFSLDFEVTNPWWMQAVIAEASTVDNADGSYTHTFSGDTPLPMRLYAGYEANATSGTDPLRRILKGCVIQTATIDTSVEDTATVSLTGAYADEETQTVTSLDPQPELQEDVMTFAEAALQLGGSTLSLVQDASIEINNNVDIKRELGTRVGVDYSPKGRTITVDWTQIRKNNDQIEEMYGSSGASAVQESVDSSSPMTYELDNGLAAGSGINQLFVDMDGAFPESVATENLGNPQEDLQESVSNRLKTVSAEATNETSSAL